MKTTAAQKLIEAAASNGGSVEFTVGAGSGNTLNTLKALERAGYKPEFLSGKWQSKDGMQYRLVAQTK